MAEPDGSRQARQRRPPEAPPHPAVASCGVDRLGRPSSTPWSSMASQHEVRSAVLPAAGLGTRFLPATKAIPKELLPLVDRPAIQYAVEECARAGLEDVVLVTSRGKAALEDHFDRDVLLEQALEAKGKDELLAAVRHAAGLAHLTAVRQPQPLGLGHAVLMAADHVGDRSFAVLLPDDLIDPADPLLERMIALHQRSGQGVVSVIEVPEDQTHRYGIVNAKPTDEDDVFEVTELVEKPAPGTAPSNLSIVARYVLPGRIFEILRDLPPGRGGEIQLTDAMQVLADEQPLLAVRHDGLRHDSGELLGWLQANVTMAATRDGVREDFVPWLRDFVAGL